MGKVLSIIPRQVQRFNIENRAHKVISKEKPTPAPKYPGTLKDLERFAQEHPEFLEEHAKKNTDLDNRLKQVYIVSHDPKVAAKNNPNRPLPLSREAVDLPEYGFVEPKSISQGKVTLRQAIQFISNYQSTPKEWTVQKISEDHNLNPQSVENVLKYFYTFEVFIPKTKGSRKTMVVRSSDHKKLEGPDP